MAVSSTSAPSASTTSVASTNSSATNTLPVTSNGMTIVGGSLPDSSERDYCRCVRLGCKHKGHQRCVRRYCKPCCQEQLLENGQRCSVHPGTTPQQLPKEKGAAQVFDPDEDDPLDANVTYSRNLQREWQDHWADTEGRALADVNYRTTGQRLTRTEFHCTIVWVWHEVSFFDSCIGRYILAHIYD